MEPCRTEYFSSSPEETGALGERLAEKLIPGSVVALRGALGAGKTCLIQGIARGLGITENITSPTYTIASEYPSPCGPPLYHIDAYRLISDEDFDNTGAGELLGGGGITVIEWSERVPGSIPADAVFIEIEIVGPEKRLIKIRN